MLTRRDMVTTGALGAFSAVASPTPDAGEATAEAQSPETVSAQALSSIANDLDQIRIQMREALIGPSLNAGVIADVRKQFQFFLKSNLKFPDYCEIGTAVFLDVYDWHVRYQQPIEMSRVDNRMAIRFMFTWLILRPEQAEGYVGIPFDRG
jgi:hypothetical protein